MFPQPAAVQQGELCCESELLLILPRCSRLQLNNACTIDSLPPPYSQLYCAFSIGCTAAAPPLHPSQTLTVSEIHELNWQSG